MTDDYLDRVPYERARELLADEPVKEWHTGGPAVWLQV
jgi:hypothetical protein